MDLMDKRILLTGATGGIGSEIASILSEKGAELVLVGRQRAGLENLVQSLRHPERHQCLVADIATSLGMEEIDRHCMDMQRQGKPVDVLINNAGCNTFQYLKDRDADSLRREVDVNLMTPILLCQQAMHWLSGEGIILNIGSTFGAIGYPGYTSYCAAKAGLQRFSEALDRELGREGQRVLFLAPRATNTALNDSRVQAMNQKLGNKTDDASFVAAQVIQALTKEKTTTWLGWPEKLFVKINQIFPSVVASAIQKQHDVITEYATTKHAATKR